MSQAERHIRRANEILRELDADFPGGDGSHPLFQWQWSDTMVSIIPQFNFEGETVYEYRCVCGVDVRAHRADCRGSIAKVKMIRVPTFGLEGEFQSYSRVWVLCRWNAPPDKEDWIEVMGSDEDYPGNGRYLPVHRGLACVVIPPKVPSEHFEEVSRLTVSMMRKHIAEFREELERDKAKAQRLDLPLIDSRGRVTREPDKNSRYWAIKEQFQERMPSFNPTGTVGYAKEILNADS